jgi:hypothetical protein
VRRQLFVEAGFYFDERFSGSEDYDFCLRLAEVTRLANLPQPLYFYRQHQNSVSRSQRYQQMFRKAAALEEAGRRRFANNLPNDFVSLVARDYLRAVVLAYASGQVEEAKAALRLSLSSRPTLLAKTEPLETILRRYLPEDGEQAITFVESIFANLLPQNQHLAKLQAHLLAELHMNELFSSVSQNQLQQIDAHLWSAIRLNPRWLLNRGVLSLAIRRLLRLI